MSRTVVKMLSKAGLFAAVVGSSGYVWAGSIVAGQGPYVADYTSSSSTSNIAPNPCLTTIVDFDDSLMTDEEKLQALMLQQEILMGGISDCNQQQTTALTEAAGKGGGGGGGGGADSSGGGSGPDGTASGAGTDGQTGASPQETPVNAAGGSDSGQGTGTSQIEGMPGGAGKPVGNRTETNAMKPMCDNFRAAAADAKNPADREYEVSEGRKLGCNM